MLRFQTTPDTTFLDILDEAINEAIANIEMEEDSPDEQQESFGDTMPHSSKFLAPQEAKNQLEILQRASRATKLYQPTDYHWLLLYEALDEYCQLFNDGPFGLVFERYGIERLNMELLVYLFFWDTDYLDDSIANMPLTAREALDVSPETFGLAMGLKPHPEELALKPCDPSKEEPPGTFFIPGSKEYPALMVDPSDGLPGEGESRRIKS